jgi:hypothetical protein
MHKTTLVDADIEGGRRVLAALEQRGVRVTAAFWSQSEDEDDWSLVVVSPDVPEKGPTTVYKELLAVLKDLDIKPPGPLHSWWNLIKIISPASLIYQRAKQYSGSRFGPVKEHPALDAYIYKMT